MTIVNITAPDTDIDVAADVGDGGIDRRQLALFDTWATNMLDSLDDPAVRRTIATYLRWGQQRRLARAAVTNVLAPWSTHAARQQTRCAVEFVTWTTNQQVALGDVDQRTIDAWFAEGTTTRIHTRHFLVWAQQQRLLQRSLWFPIIIPGAGNPLPAPARDALVGRLIDDTTIADDVRVAGLLVALYAQPVNGVARYAKAHALWSLAAAQGDPVAHCFLGSLYEFGLGITANRTIARNHYLAADAANACRSSKDAIARLKE